MPRLRIRVCDISFTTMVGTKSKNNFSVTFSKKVCDIPHGKVRTCCYTVALAATLT